MGKSNKKIVKKVLKEISRRNTDVYGSSGLAGCEVEVNFKNPKKKSVVGQMLRESEFGLQLLIAPTKNDDARKIFFPWADVEEIEDLDFSADEEE